MKRWLKSGPLSFPLSLVFWITSFQFLLYKISLIIACILTWSSAIICAVMCFLSLKWWRSHLPAWSSGLVSYLSSCTRKTFWHDCCCHWLIMKIWKVPQQATTNVICVNHIFIMLIGSIDSHPAYARNLSVSFGLQDRAQPSSVIQLQWITIVISTMSALY